MPAIDIYLPLTLLAVMERREASTLVDEVTEPEDKVLVHPARQKSVEVLEVGVDETTEE